MVMIQWPSTLDSACALALVQEEVGDAHRSKDFRRSAQFFSVASYKSLSSPSKFDKKHNEQKVDGLALLMIR
jgi:hypothetical protein